MACTSHCIIRNCRYLAMSWLSRCQCVQVWVYKIDRGLSHSALPTLGLGHSLCVWVHPRTHLLDARGKSTCDNHRCPGQCPVSPCGNHWMSPFPSFRVKPEFEFFLFLFPDLVVFIFCFVFLKKRFCPHLKQKGGSL